MSGGAAAVLDRLRRCLTRLPGVGRRSAERMAMRLVRGRADLLPEMIDALRAVEQQLCCCGQCGNVTTREADPCVLCTSPSRDGRQLCVVENPEDVSAIEQAGVYRGRYHTLMGRLSPMRGMGPDDLRLAQLVERVRSGGVEEVILATNTDTEGEATASFLAEHLRPLGVRITRLGFGLPVGSGVMYADALTLQRALRGRQSAFE